MLSLTVLLVAVAGCRAQGNAQPASPKTALPNAQPAQTISPALPQSQAVVVETPSPPPTNPPNTRTFFIVLQGYCPVGTYSADLLSRLVLCFTGDPAFWEGDGKLEYWLIMVTPSFDTMNAKFVKHGLLESSIPRPRPKLTPTPTPTPRNPNQPEPTPTRRVPWPVPVPPRIFRTITLLVQYRCEKLAMTTTWDRVTLCFPPQKELDQGEPVDYWMITITHDLTPTVQLGQLQWATPPP